MTLTKGREAELRATINGYQDEKIYWGIPIWEWRKLFAAYDALQRDLAASGRELDAANERISRLEGRRCLICGRESPCKETPEACTFDPSPIEAAREFQRKMIEAVARADGADRTIAVMDAENDRLIAEHIVDMDAANARIAELEKALAAIIADCTNEVGEISWPPGQVPLQAAHAALQPREKGRT